MNRLARVVILGKCCAGKSTLARSLSRALGIPHIELDHLYWGPNWTPRPSEEFRATVREAVTADFWVVDGNYRAIRDLIWHRATTLIWLNLPLSILFPRSVNRTLRRSLTREPLFAGNRESLRGIIDPDWVPWYVLRTYRRHRREFSTLLKQPELEHLQVLEFNSPKQIEGFLNACAP